MSSAMRLRFREGNGHTETLERDEERIGVALHDATHHHVRCQPLIAVPAMIGTAIGSDDAEFDIAPSSRASPGS